MSEVKDIDRLLEQSRKNLKGAYGVGLKGWVANIPFLIEENKSKDIKVELQNYKNLYNKKQKLLIPPPPAKKYGGKISPRRAKYS